MLNPAAQAPAPSRRGRGRGTSADTPLRIIAATLSALAEHGYAGTTARVIAARGGIPVGLIFYHFGTVDDLLLAALDHSSAVRLPRWREELADVEDLGTLMERMEGLYAEDIASGHAVAVKELVANGAFSERLRPAMASRMEPWFALAETVAAHVLAGSPVLALVPPRDLAVAAVALYLGLDTVSRLSGETTTAETLFAAGLGLAPLLGTIGGRGSRPRRSHPARVDIE
jgi:AcrR family transcriptional regulator